MLIQNFPKHCIGVLWDCLQPQVFVAFDDKSCVTFVFVKHSIDGKLFIFKKIDQKLKNLLQIGKHVVRVGESSLLSDQMPLMLYDGELSISSSGGKWSSIILSTHMNSPDIEPRDQLATLIKLRKYTESWELCKAIDNKTDWITLGNAAIADLDVLFGIVLRII